MKLVNRILAGIMSCAMAITMMPSSVFAQEIVQEAEQTAETEVIADSQAQVVALAATSSALSFSSVGGANEALFCEIPGITPQEVKEVTYGGLYEGSLSEEDMKYLVRAKAGGVRIDIPGLAAAKYTLTVKTENDSVSAERIQVYSYDRSGYAHFNASEGVGAYSEIGQPKKKAIILYVTDENKNDVELTYNGTTVKGIGNILNSVGMDSGNGKTSNGGACNTNAGILKKLALDNVPLIVRFIGTVSNTGLYKSGTFDATKAPIIEGLTIYSSADNGGTKGDNGHMARMKSAKNVTLEGIGTDAVIDGWGFHFMAETSAPELGKNFEVRNLSFINTPEDAIGMEGTQGYAVNGAIKSGDSDVKAPIAASVERCWIHNCEFYCPNILNPAQSDKKEGDGSVDFKRGQYFTCSYNYFEGCHKTNLVGAKDACLQFNLTYHHNFWYLCKARGPLARNANIHMYNNVWYGQTDYCQNVRANSYIFSEYNLFFMAKSPQRVDLGAIKSYHDSFTSCINFMDGTVVNDKTQYVPNECQYIYGKIKYDAFDTDASLSYIATGKYQLQNNIVEMRKVIASQTGVQKEKTILPSEVKMSDLSVVMDSAIKTNVETLPASYTPGKLGVQYAFTVSDYVDVTVEYASEALSATGVICNEAGECLLVGSGKLEGLEPGTYIIQCTNMQPGDAKTVTLGTFKQVTINSLQIEKSNIEIHRHNFVFSKELSVNATCTTDGKNVFVCQGCDAVKEEETLSGHKWSTSWTVDKAPTETEVGEKSHHCVVCNAKNDITTIPCVGSTYGDGVDHDFTANGLISSVYTFSGTKNLEDESDFVSYGSNNLTKGLVLEDDTKISFNATEKGTLYIIGSEDKCGSKEVMVNGQPYIFASDAGNTVCAVPVSAGAITITKGEDSGVSVLYISFIKSSSGPVIAEYYVNHYLLMEGKDASKHDTENYYLAASEVYNAEEGKTVTCDVKEYEGYQSPVPQQVTVEAGGSTVVNYYYVPGIVKKGFDIVLKEDTYVFTGRKINPEFTVYFNGKKVREGVDYTVKLKNNRDVASASAGRKAPSIMVSGIGNYKGKANAYFSITQADIIDSLLPTYSFKKGNNMNPLFIYNGYVLKKGKDYEIPGKLGKAQANGEFLVKGVGNFTGTTNVPYVVPENADTIKVTFSDQDFVFDGKDQAERMKGYIVEVRGAKTKKVLSPSEYTVTMASSAVECGDYSIIVTPNIDGYTGRALTTYTIYPKPVSESGDYILTKFSDAVYCAAGAEPDKVSITVNDIVLTENKDYTVSFADNKAATYADKKGVIRKNGKAIFKFKGNYTGTVTVKYNIVPAKLKNANVYCNDIAKYTKAGVYISKPTVVISGSAIKSSDFVAEYYTDQECTKLMNKANPLTFAEGATFASVYVKVRGKGNNISNAEEDCGYGEYKVYAKPASKGNDLSTAKVKILDDNGFEVKSIQYAGAPLKPELVVEVGGNQLIKDKDYVITGYSNNVKKGRATVYIAAKPGSEYVGGKAASFGIGSYDIFTNIYKVIEYFGL